MMIKKSASSPKKLKPEDFGADYFSSGGYDEYETDVASWVPNMAKTVLRLIDKEHPQILDVGCAQGYLLAELKKRGAGIAGLEFSKFAIQRAAKSIRPHIRRGSILTAFFPKNAYDAVICLDVFPYFTEKEMGRAAKNLVGWSRGIVFFASLYRHSRQASQKVNPDSLRKTTLSQKEYAQIFRRAGAEFFRAI